MPTVNHYDTLEQKLRGIVPLDDDLIWVDFDHLGRITRVRKYIEGLDEVLAVDIVVRSVNMGFECQHKFQGGAYGIAKKRFGYFSGKKFEEAGVRLVKKLLQYNGGGKYIKPFYHVNV